MKKTYLFKLFPTIFLALLVFSFVFYENKVIKNVENCEKVKIGMSIEQVVEIMGNTAQQQSYNAKINQQNRDIIDYYYKAPSGSSSGINIYFDKTTKQVLKKECME